MEKGREMNISVDVIPDLYDELSNALTPVLGYMQLLAQELSPKSPYYIKVRRIVSVVKKSIKVVENLMELSIKEKIKEGK